MLAVCRMPNRTQPGNTIGYAKFFSPSHDAVTPVYDAAGNMIETHEHAGAYMRDQQYEGNELKC
jgi:hypothetical protein